MNWLFLRIVSHVSRPQKKTRSLHGRHTATSVPFEQVEIEILWGLYRLVPHFVPLSGHHAVVLSRSLSTDTEYRHMEQIGQCFGLARIPLDTALSCAIILTC